jgi:hypothetical protein
MKTKYHLTFDIDWAPDFCVENVLNILKKKNVKATFFLTHKSDIIKDISKDGHKIGIHPNFFKGSTQGKGNLNIVENLLNLSDNIDCMRTHGLYQSTNMFLEICTEFNQLKYDFSIYTPSISSKKFKWSYQNISFWRYNYNWEDDFEFGDSFPRLCDLNQLEHLILDFHPIHIFLNSKNFSNYNMLKSNFNISELSEKEAKKFINHDRIGSQRLLDELISSELESFDPILEL